MKKTMQQRLELQHEKWQKMTLDAHAQQSLKGGARAQIIEMG